ncbi:MAG: F0F1 ATP synthase subunit A [Actinomycetota bacterium]|nr:F0F1 ATP synthase subunit A [Actinomycetota bacterium]
MDLILAASECDPVAEIICVPANVNDLFELPFIGGVNRTMLLMGLAALIVVALLWFGLRRRPLVPTKFEAAIEGIVLYIRDEVALGIIGPKDGIRFFPYLLALFMFILIGNLFEIAPAINFPITSRIGLPAFLALLTWVIFVFMGFKRQGAAYVGHILWPPGVPTGLKPLVGIIEFVSTFLVRPFSLAVRLFANLVAGHVMLTLLLVSGYVFITSVGDIGAKALVGVGWFALGLGIYVFELLVAVLQAYIFTLLSAVYIQTSVHPEH